MMGHADQVVVVLGCRVIDGQPSGALERRLIRARQVALGHPQLPVLFSGGKIWDGVSESQAMNDWWTSHGTKTPVLLENESLTTLGNARCVARLCAEHHFRMVHLVTCDVHMPRARRMFSGCGLTVVCHEAMSSASGWERLRAQAREWAARCLSPIESLIK